MSGSNFTVISSNEEFRNKLAHLDHHCFINCRLRLAPGEEHLLVELLERNIQLIPSATSLLASRSKVHQALVFHRYMLPATTRIYGPADLLAAISHYNAAGIGEVVIKRDRKNGGFGIHRFPSIEDVHNFSAFGKLDFPLVLQPFVQEFRDIRVIVLGEYQEAYERINPGNFRHNLHCGGQAKPVELTVEQLRFCKQVMEHGKFPYAHLDLMLMPGGEVYLTEINLRGGLRGAKLDGRRYLQLVKDANTKVLTDALTAKHMP